MADKRIENRSRRDGERPPIVLHRGPLLLHAAQSWDESALVFFATKIGVEAPPFKNDHRAGVIFARCKVVGHIEPWACSTCERWEPVDRAKCTACSGTLDDSLDLRWWMGGYAMVLADVEPIRPVECRGAQGLWTPPANVVQVALDAEVLDDE